MIKAHKEVKGSKTYVVVTEDGVEIGRLGGKRAERAQAVLVQTRKNGNQVAEGLRADVAAAQKEADRMSRGKSGYLVTYDSAEHTVEFLGRSETRAAFRSGPLFFERKPSASRFSDHETLVSAEPVNDWCAVPTIAVVID